MIDRKLAPAISEIQKFSIKQAESLFIGNIPVHLLRSGSQPLLRLEFVFRAGNYYENKSGLSYLTAKMLNEGTLKYSSKEIAETVATLGAFLEIHHGNDFVNITFFLLEKHLATLLPLISNILSESIFPQDELDNLKNITNHNLTVNKEKGQFLSSVEFRKLLFGSNHPYGRQYWEEDISNIQRDELVNYYKEFFPLNNVELFVSGQFDEETLVDLLARYFDNVKETSRQFLKIEAPLTKTQEEVLVEKAEFMQSSIRLGSHCISRKHSDFPAFAVLNEVLGGFFGSRLMKNIREDKGYTYGIHSSIQAMDHATYFTIATDVKKENTHHTLTEVWKEMEVLKNELVPKEELLTVRSYMLGKFVNSINTPFALMDKFKILHFNGLDYEYFDNYIAVVQSISPDMVRDLANTYFQRERFSQVVVGGLE